MIPSDEWKKGPEHIARRVDDLKLKHAVRSTPNAETITLNEATGRLRAEPLTDLPEDQLADALDRLRDGTRLFDFTTPQGNQYRSIQPDCAIIEDAVARYGARPRMLHGACVRVMRRLDIRMKQGECPTREQDADIDDFYGMLLRVSVDLMEHDPHVREAVTASAAVRLADLPSKAAETIMKAADEVADRSEGDLARELPEDARCAVDPSMPASERREALYITVSRLLRVWLLTGYSGTKSSYRAAKHMLEEIESVSKTAAGITKNASIIAAGTATLTTPLWLKPAVEWILKLF